MPLAFVTGDPPAPSHVPGMKTTAGHRGKRVRWSWTTPQSISVVMLNHVHCSPSPQPSHQPPNLGSFIPSSPTSEFQPR